MQAAVSYALLFGVDPMAFLDRQAQDLPVLRSLIDIADARIRAAQKEVTHGQRR